MPDQLKRCECCLGMGYKGRSRRGKWKIETCSSCRGSGQVPTAMRQRRATNKLRS